MLREREGDEVQDGRAGKGRTRRDDAPTLRPTRSSSSPRPPASNAPTTSPKLGWRAHTRRTSASARLSLSSTASSRLERCARGFVLGLAFALPLTPLLPLPFSFSPGSTFSSSSPAAADPAAPPPAALASAPISRSTSRMPSRSSSLTSYRPSRSHVAPSGRERQNARASAVRSVRRTAPMRRLDARMRTTKRTCSCCAERRSFLTSDVFCARTPVLRAKEREEGKEVRRVPSRGEGQDKRAGGDAPLELGDLDQRLVHAVAFERRRLDEEADRLARLERDVARVAVRVGELLEPLRADARRLLDRLGQDLCRAGAESVRVRKR